MSIKSSSKVSIRGKATLNSVRGNQINHTKTIIISRATKRSKRDEYDEFEYVKRGDIVTVKDIHYKELEVREWEPQGEGRWVAGRLLRKTKRRIFAIELKSDQKSSHKFTAFTYEDDDAHSFWEDDFREFSRNRTTDSLQLFGLNRSEIPMLIFHHELVPLAHFHKSSFWGDIYLAYLSRSKDWWLERIWMDESTGTLCCGPDGPAWMRNFTSAHERIIVPTSREMLENDASFRFLSKFTSKALNDYVLGWAQRQWECIHLNDLLPNVAGDLPSEDRQRFDWRAEYPYLEHVWRDTDCHFPVDIIGSLRFDTIYSPTRGAVARLAQVDRPWTFWETHADESSIGRYVSIEIPSPGLRISRISRQYDGLAAFFRLCDAEAPPPIHLVLYPPPMCISELKRWLDGDIPTHFWFCDETGQMSEDELEEWGIPELVPCLSPTLQHDFLKLASLRSLPPHICKALRDWQIVQGYDPSTADYARYMGYPEYEIVNEPWPRQAETSESHQAEDQEEEKEEAPIYESTWWEAIPGSGISAFGF
ncbi:hypothetical protein VNI00_017604 [Paramarasmius palmivorus]|uniref:Uncharacterized protein n=1 Tax=Paramarasmius palmivorus TaxID=297713 RepID=A0AAW0B3P5_9AGAR